MRYLLRNNQEKTEKTEIGKFARFLHVTNNFSISI